MRKSLSAEIYRCGHSLLFWLTLFASILSGVIYGIVSMNGFFEGIFVVPLFIISAVFISLNTGREYTDNTIRNKIITGTSKITILLSKLVMGIGIGILFCVAFLIPCTIILSFTVHSEISASVLCLTLVGFVLLSVVWAVLFTVIGMLVSAKGIGIVINFVLVIASILLSYPLESALRQPEFLSGSAISQELMTPEEVKQIQEGTFHGSYSAVTDENGQVTYYKEVITDMKRINPEYVRSPFREILTHLDAMLPQGQINEYVLCLSYSAAADRQTDDPEPFDVYPRVKTFPLYSCFEILLFSGIGLILFRKKEIR